MYTVTMTINENENIVDDEDGEIVENTENAEDEEIGGRVENTYLLHVTDINSPVRLYNAIVTQSINEIHTFTFTIYYSHPQYDKMIEMRSRIDVKSERTETIEFRGYIVKTQEFMDDSGKLYKNVVCESALGYLYDSIQKHQHKVLLNGDPLYALITYFIDKHNGRVAKFKEMEILEDSYTNKYPEKNGFFRFDYCKSFDVLKYILERWGGEFRVRYLTDPVNNRTLAFDYHYEGFGELVEDTPIKLAKNMKNLSIFNDTTDTISRLYVYGSTPPQSQTDNERINIEAVNFGKQWIQDDEARKAFGVVSDLLIINEELTGSTPEAITAYKMMLLEKGKQHLAERSKVTRNISTAVIDLSVIGLDESSFELYNSYPLIHEYLGINEIVRVVKKTFDINAPHLATIEIGSKKMTATQLI